MGFNSGFKGLKSKRHTSVQRQNCDGRTSLYALHASHGLQEAAETDVKIKLSHSTTA